MATLASLLWHDDAQHMTSVGSAVQTYFLYDGLGFTTGLTDGSANVIDSCTYDVFGAIRL